MVILCFERRFSKQNRVVRLNSKQFPPQFFWPPPNFWAGYATANLSSRLTSIANLPAAVTFVILSVYETKVHFQCFHFVELSTTLPVVSNTCGFKHVSIKIELLLLSLTDCAERNNRHALSVFIQLRNAVHSENQTEAVSVNRSMPSRLHTNDATRAR